jgi:hypothetical protein
MEVRLVAYRRETSAAGTYDVTNYELDLQEIPNVVVNYNFLDLQKPESRKTNFSQTLKLPFSNKNNEFFENWFDVNLDTLVFNTKTKFEAVLLIDSIPQLKGFIELKSIFLNARLYEIALFGDTANFFTAIKGKKLQDAFLVNDEDSVDLQLLSQTLDHKLTLDNIYNSWTSPGLTGVLGNTTNDVMYPIIDWGHTINPYSSAMFWDPSDLWDINTLEGDTSQVLNTYGFVQASHLKPAIRIQRLFHIIAAKAGYQIKSSFMGIDDTNASTPITDTSFFSRLFMTLSTETERVQTLHNTSTGTEAPFVGFEAESSSSQTDLIPLQASDLAFEWGNVVTMFDSLIINNEIYDPNNLYNDQLADWDVPGVSGFPNTPSIRIPDSNGDNALLPAGAFYVQVNLDILIASISSTLGTPVDGMNMELRVYRQSTGTIYSSYEFYVTSGTPSNQIQQNMPIEGNPGEIYYFTLNSVPTSVSYVDDSFDYIEVTVQSAQLQTLYTGDTGLMSGGLNGTVQMFHNMPNISQSDFVKDLINRFNLVINCDADNEKLLIIEPYSDYVSASAKTLYWTDKLDVSKEQVIQSTNKMQYKHLKFSDLEDKDILNERYTNTHNVVYGEYNEIRDNDFAGKEFKNFSIMSPFIAQGIGQWGVNGIQGGYQEGDIALAYCFEAAEGEERDPIAGIKPKLFYYSGTPVPIDGENPLTGTQFNFHLLGENYLESTSSAKPTSTVSNPQGVFPLCLQYNLDSLGDVSTTTKILNWTYYTPNFNSGFTFNFFGNVYSTHGYYNDYWSQYINEIYSDESRIMECYINLTPEDIMSFSGTGFQYTYYIKNTLWRILKISNHLVGGNKSTKVTLLKVIDKLAYECGAIPQGSLSGQITFTDAQTGLTVSATNTCCEDVNPDWTFVQTNATTGTGTCWSSQPMALALPPNPNNGDGTQNNPQAMLMPNIETNFNIESTMGNGNNSTFYLQAVTGDSSTANNFSYSGVQSQILLLKPLSMNYVKISLIGSIVSGTNSSKCGYLEYDTLLVNRNQFSYHVGAAGGTLLKTNKDTAFTAPTVSFTTFDSRGFWAPTITGGANEQVSWIAKVEIIQQPLGDPGGVMIPTSKALYENSAGILFEDLNNLEWN